ncbi:MAG: nitroreductase family protein [Dehalococcoidales bacterium]|nr:nitroreductase family protein [Dehalococcoidales bacterium]
MEVFEAIKTRRSIRQHKSEPIDEETLEKILEAARWAPSWANTQCWRFIVVHDSNLKAQVADTLSRRKKPDGTISVNVATKVIMEAPVLIVACAELNRSGCRNGTPTTDKGGYWYMFDTALAIQNLCLAAHALGLGTVIIGDFDAKRVAEILGVPEGFSVVTMTPLGFPAHEGKPPHRKELPEIVFNNRFRA